VLALSALLLDAGACGESSGEEAGGGADGTDTGTTGGQTTGEEPPAGEASDICSAAPAVGVGLWTGSLRDKSRNLGGACGAGGPDAFFKVPVPLRADVRLEAFGVGFTPRLGAVFGDCVADWENRGLLCTEGLGGWLTDLAAGTDLYVSIGIDPEDPVLDTSAPEEGPDPLQFALEVTIRRILEPGDLCLPSSRGRCVVGSACLPGAADGDGTETSTSTGGDGTGTSGETGQDGATGGSSWRCVSLEADTCASAQTVAVAMEGTTLPIEPGWVHTDAHHHSCAGARVADRVYRLELPSDMEPGSALDITVDEPEAALAVRLPGCTQGEEIACQEREAAGATVTIDDADALAASGVSPYLFVEFPFASGSGGATTGEAPFSLQITVLGG
jgi:hypothetical protein